jgi:hypothetical protein
VGPNPKEEIWRQICIQRKENVDMNMAINKPRREPGMHHSLTALRKSQAANTLIADL